MWTNGSARRALQAWIDCGEIVLADAGLAEDQDADVVVENFPDRLEDVPHRGVPRAKEIPEARLTKSS